jgi:hypothetical protein
MSNVVRLEYAYGVCPKCKRVHYLRYLIHNDGLIHKPYEIKCINCNSYFAKEDILGSGEETAPKPITNADRIRSMTDEELAAWLFHHSMVCVPGKRPNPEDCVGGCEHCWLDWLKEEAKE